MPRRRIADALFGAHRLESVSSPSFIIGGTAIQRQDDAAAGAAAAANEGTCNNNSNSPNPSHVISYGEAANACVQHEYWLEAKLLSLTKPRSSSSVPLKDESAAAEAAAADLNQTNEGDVLVAYLAANTADAILSVVAAASLCSVATTTTTTTVAAPALLNTRWTVSELVAAVSGGAVRNVTAATARSFTTILLYTDEHQGTAHQVVQQLQSHWHRAVAFRIPHFCHATMPASKPTRPRSHVRPRCTTSENGDDDDDDDAVIVFTSGTSGHAKGVRLGHRAILVQCHAKLQPPCSYTSHTRLVISTTVPLFHVGGLSSILAVLLAGGCLMVHAMPASALTGRSAISSASFDPELVWKALDTNGTVGGANTLVVVPTMLYALQEHQNNRLLIDTTKKDAKQDGSNVDRPCATIYNSVELIVIGGQSASAALLHFVHTVFPRARVVQTYACTEAASSLTFRPIPEPPPHPSRRIHAASAHSPDMGGDCVGWPPRHVHLAIVSTERNETNNHHNHQRNMHPTLHPLPPFTVGIVATRGPHVMNGYWLRGTTSRCERRTQRRDNLQQEATLSTLDTMGWMRTGDLGYLDDTGCLYLLGRESDSIRTGGETVMAAEVERVVQEHPAVLECAVFGVRDMKYGETVCCVIVRHTDSATMAFPHLTIDSVRQWCSQQGLAGYKRPRRVYTLHLPLPRNSAGKVLKYQLKRQFDVDSGESIISKL